MKATNISKGKKSGVEQDTNF